MRQFSIPVAMLPQRLQTPAFRGCLKIVATLMILGAIPAIPAWGQGAPKLTYQDLPLTTKDGIDLKITYFKSPAGQEAPVVVMLHGKGGSRLVWKSYAELLQKAEFAVITVDMRGHGESTGGGGTSGKKTDNKVKANDYTAMIAGDMDAIKRFIFEEHQIKNLNMNKMGIVAADFTTPVAIAFTEIDWAKQPYDDSPVPGQGTPRGQDVQVLALLSPEATAPGVPVLKILGDIRNLRRPVLIAVGSKNPADMRAAKQLHEVLAPKKDDGNFYPLKTYDVKLRGTDLFGNGLKMEEDLFNFLFDNLKAYKSPWRDRKSLVD